MNEGFEDTDDARKVAIKLLSSDRSQSPKEKKENLRPKKNGQVSFETEKCKTS